VVSGERALNAADAVVCPVPPCVIVAVPLTFVNAGCEQLAFPLVEIPVAHLLLVHCVGLDASAVAVVAFPVVLLEIVAGRSVADKPRNVGVTAGPESGPANTVLAA
jgi:hypothetical protein